MESILLSLQGYCERQQQETQCNAQHSHQRDPIHRHHNCQHLCGKSPLLRRLDGEGTAFFLIDIHFDVGLMLGSDVRTLDTLCSEAANSKKTAEPMGQEQPLSWPRTVTQLSTSQKHRPTWDDFWARQGLDGSPEEQVAHKRLGSDGRAS